MKNAPLAMSLATFSEMLADIIRSEVRLARARLKREVGKSANAENLCWLEPSFLYTRRVFLLGLVYALALVIPLLERDFAVAAAAGLISVLLISSGRQRLLKINPKTGKNH